MSFFDPSKTPGAMPAGATTGFTPSATGAGDAAKPLAPSFPLPGAQQNQPKPGGLFGSGMTGTPAPAYGATPASFGAQTTTASTGFNFGGVAPNATLSFGTPKTTGTAAPTAFTLGSTPTSTPATQQPATQPLFGGAAPAATSTASSTGFTLGGTPAPASTGGLTFSLGNTSTPATTSSVLTLGAPASSTSTGFTLAATTSAPAASTTFSLGTPAPVTTTSLGFSVSGATSTSSGFNLGSTAPTLSTGFSLGKTTAATSAATPAVSSAPQATLGSATTVTASATSGQTGGMNFCQLEEAINKWTLELEEQEKAFVNQATQVNSWDKLLIANGEKIVTLNKEVERVKLEQQQLEHELDYVVGQQKELQDCLVPLEKELASLSVSDPEREYTYNLAENLDTQLKQMSEDLKEIIEHLNEANRAQDSSDPIVQIGKILNAHMNSLQWLDQRTSILGQKIQQIDQMHQNFRQENERSFSLAYN